MRILTLVLASFLIASPAAADRRGDDQAAIEQTITDLYAVISGPVGEPRDWDAFRAMYLPHAVMGAVSAGPEGNGRATTFSPDGYIERSGEFLVTRGFTETPTRNEIEIWGEVAYVRSAYEGFVSDTGEMIVKGVNFITLFKVDGEWRIASLLWRQETDYWQVGAAFSEDN